MKQYGIYLKSHTNAPDYENWTYANSKEEALDFFHSNLGKYGWDKDQLLEHIEIISGGGE